MIDKPLLIAVLLLMIISLIMSYTLSVYTALYYGYNDMHFFWRQLIAIFISIFIIVILSWGDPDRDFNRLGFVVFVLSSLALIAMPFMPDSVVKSILGAKRWIHIGPISIAPVEFFKIGFVFFLAWSFPRKITHHGHLSIKEEMTVIMPYVAVLLIAVILIAIFQKDLGQTVVIAFTLFVLFVMAGRSLKLFAIFIVSGLFAFILLVFSAPHRIARIKSWWSMIQDRVLEYFPSNLVEYMRIPVVKEPYQISNSLNAIQNGGVFGQGLGNGQFKLGYLSEVHTDFIMAGLSEELGMIGFIGVSLLIFFIVIRLFIIASRLKKWEYYIFTVGVALLIIFSFIINTYGISGLTPIKGIAVPFLSYGGSQMIASSLGIGMVLMISKKAKVGEMNG